MNTKSIFASNISITSLDDELNTIDVSNVEFDGAINAGQTSSKSKSLYILNDYKHLCIEILNKFHEISYDVLRYNNSFTISTSWITRVKPGDSSQYHCHKNSFYSGLYYFDDYRRDCGNICFVNPLNQLSDFHLRPRESNLYNSEAWSYTPEKNALIFFPSYLWHTILNNLSDRVRYSLAFNIVPVGEYGNGDSTYNTEWFKK